MPDNNHRAYSRSGFGESQADSRIVKRYGLEKLKTIGDAYMCAGGIPIKNSSHPVDAVLAAFEFLEVVERLNQQMEHPWSIRIGIHTGPIAAGVVGINKFAFDVWGDTVNFTSRLESTSAPNRINVSAATFSRIMVRKQMKGVVPSAQSSTQPHIWRLYQARFIQRPSK